MKHLLWVEYSDILEQTQWLSQQAVAYAPLALPFVRELAAKKVLEKIMDLAMIDIQFPSSIDEIAKKKQKKRIKGRVEASDHL